MRYFIIIFLVLFLISCGGQTLFAFDWPYECTWSAFDANYSLIDKTKTYAFMGDSYTYRYSFQTGFPAADVKNYAIGSQKIDDCIRDQLPLALAQHPDVAFVMIGANDLAANGTISTAMKTSYIYLINELTNAGIKAYCLTLIPVPDPWRNTLINPSIYFFNAWIEMNFVNVVDVGLYYSPFTGGGAASNQYYVSDGHLNHAGYYFYVKALFDHVIEWGGNP